MSDLFETYRGAVQPWECDRMRHMNVMHYVGKFDQATWKLFAAIGLTETYMQESQRGVAAVRQNITYRRELLAGDMVVIRSGILAMSRRQIQFYHEMANDDDEIAATTVITGVCLDTHARKMCPFPEDVVAHAEQMIVDRMTIV